MPYDPEFPQNSQFWDKPLHKESRIWDKPPNRVSRFWEAPLLQNALKWGRVTLFTIGDHGNVGKSSTPPRLADAAEIKKSRERRLPHEDASP